MRVLHISSSDSMGGAAQSAYRLHRALADSGRDSVFFAAEKLRKEDSTVISFTNGYVWRRVLAILDALVLYPYPRRTRKFPFTSNWFHFTGIRRIIRRVKPDVIHLHWVGKGLIRLEDLGGLKLPIVWTMHDNYPFTGGCHLVNDCLKYRSVCGACPQLASWKSTDRSTVNFRRKQKLYPALNITFLAPSSWMRDLAAESTLLRAGRIERIPNVPGSGSYYPEPRSVARQKLSLSNETRVVLFGALDALTDPNKGFDQLTAAINALPYGSGVRLLVFGAQQPADPIPLKYECSYLGYISDAETKRALYAAADVVVVPSRVENLSNVILEAMSCGTPVVAFRTGGNGDLVDHGVNGYLATAGDTEDLKR